MIRVTLVCAPLPRTVHEEDLRIPQGCTAEQAVVASALPQAFPGLDWRALQAGVWGRAVDWNRRLEDGDRLELCRPLTVDPKVARRERFARQGARATGLFARRRAGAKAGY
ncbi:RnfH family protein [Variovorax sp.]|uniref:RnfH family protein n=1 Tax=Variovorax sp. TaxID=1871043 RepID=UPI002D2C7153|nr:RnfH family protein [Variovorax sp.]HYP86150.1 RnfH family protein [Variovorax sp.]